MTTATIIISYPWISKDKTLIQDENGNEPVIQPYKGLRESVVEVAKKELREEKHMRETILEQFREWINKNRDIENCILDDNFLLKFLRTKKFSLVMAQQMLLKYLNFRENFRQYCFDLDYTSPKLLNLIESGYLFASPFRDSAGRRVIIGLGNNLDAYKNTALEMAKVHIITYETLLNDEENQVLGFTHIGDGKGVTMAHVTLWSPSEFGRIIRWGEQSFPMRHKKIYALNVPAGLKYVYDLACGLVPSKIRERIQMCTSYEDIAKSADRIVLPKEMGGEMPMKEMIELWKQELAVNRERLLSYDKIKLLSDQGIMRRRNKTKDMTGTGSLPGSFRKLELD